MFDELDISIIFIRGGCENQNSKTPEFFLK
jgi:hypothetical protein